MTSAASSPPIWMPRSLAVWPLARLIPYANNARVHSDEQIAAIARSIAKFGFLVPVLVDEAGVIIAGHGRTLAAEKLGMVEVPVVIDDHMTDDEKRAYVVADNQLAEMATWNYELLAQEVRDVGDLSQLLGFSEKQLLELNPPEDPEAIAGQEECADVKAENVVTRPGDLWLVGPHRILCGSCREIEDVARLAAGERIHLAVTSPPYAAQRKYDELSGFRPVPADEYIGWYQSVVSSLLPHLAADGSYFMNLKEHAENGRRHLYVKELVVVHCRQWGLEFIDEFVWKKAGVPGGWSNRLKNAWEPIFHFATQTQIRFFPLQISKVSANAFEYSVDANTVEMQLPRDTQVAGEAGRLYKGIGTAGGRARKFVNVDAVENRRSMTKLNRVGLARPSNVIEIKADMESNGHPAPYPVGLPEFFIRGFSLANDRIYDPFMGSGTTMLAAHKHGRRALGAEISAKYVDMQIWRMRKLFPQIAVVHEATGKTFEQLAAERSVAVIVPTAQPPAAEAGSAPVAPPKPRGVFGSGSKVSTLRPN